MSNVHEQLLAEALDLMESGLSVEEIVSRYPAQAAELRPFLLTAAALSSLATQPTVSAESRSKQALLAAAVERPARAAARDAAGRRPRRLLAPALAVLVVIFLGGAGLAGASGSAVPGDALYSAKRLIEETRLNLTTNPERAAALREQFRQERLEEIEQLLATGRSAEVSLVGEVESLAPMIVAGIPITLSADTVMEGTPNVGDEVRVDGRTDNGAVLAERIVVLSGRVAEPERDEQPEAPPATAEPAAENDNENGDSANDDDYDSSMPGAGVTATSPPPPQATLTPAATPSPSATPVVGDNGNDNGDEDNENGDAGDDDGDDGNDNDDNSGSGGGENDNDNDSEGDSDNDNDNGNDNDHSSGPGGGDNDDDSESDNDNDSESDSDNDNDNDSESDSGNDNDDNSGPGGGENDNDNDAESDSDNDSESDNGNDNDDSSGPGGGENDNGNDNDNNSGPGGGG